MAVEGVRVFQLARRLRVGTAAILAAGKVLGIGLKGSLSLIPAERVKALEEYLQSQKPAGDGQPEPHTARTLDDLFRKPAPEDGVPRGRPEP
jgi:hypothetical protein